MLATFVSPDAQHTLGPVLNGTGRDTSDSDDRPSTVVTPRPYSTSPMSSSSVSFDDELMALDQHRVNSPDERPPLLFSGDKKPTCAMLLNGDAGDDLFRFAAAADEDDFDVDAALSFEDGADLLTQLHRAKTCVEVLRRHLAVERDKVSTLTRTVEEERATARKLRAAAAKERDLKREYLAELQAYRNGGGVPVANGRSSAGGTSNGSSGDNVTVVDGPR